LRVGREETIENASAIEEKGRWVTRRCVTHRRSGRVRAGAYQDECRRRQAPQSAPRILSRPLLSTAFCVMLIRGQRPQGESGCLGWSVGRPVELLGLSVPVGWPPFRHRRIALLGCSRHPNLDNGGSAHETYAVNLRSLTL
jgi:hypothetical protein